MDSSENLILFQVESYHTIKSIQEETNGEKQNDCFEEPKSKNPDSLIKIEHSFSLIQKPKVVPVPLNKKIGSISKFSRGNTVMTSSLKKQLGFLDQPLTNAFEINRVKKNFEDSQKNIEADFKFLCSEKNLKGLLDEMLVSTSHKKEILEKKERKLMNMINETEFSEIERKNDNTVGNYPLFTTEMSQQNATYLTEVLTEKMKILNGKKEKIHNEKKIGQTLNYMKEKRKRNLLFYKNQCLKTEKLLDILKTQKTAIDKTSNDLITDQILSRVTISEFKKDLSANKKFQRTIIDRKTELENHDKSSLKTEITKYLQESSKIKHYKESLDRKKNEIKELDERAHFLKNVQIHVKKNSLDYIDRISEIFLYNKPEEFILDNFLDLDAPLIKKRSQESSESNQNKLNPKGKNQKICKKQPGFNPQVLGLNLRNIINSNLNLQIPSMISLNTFASNANIYLNNKEIEDPKKIKGVEKDSLMMRINDFYLKHYDNIPTLANLIIQEHTKLAFQEESLNNIIFDLSEQLRKHKKTYAKIVETLNDLIKQNDNQEYVDYQHDLLLTETPNKLKKSGSGECNVISLEDEFSTICGLKLEINGFHIDKTKEFQVSQKLQLFVFQSYFFFQENLLRLLSLLFAICRKMGENKKLTSLVLNLFELLNENDYEDIARNEIYIQIKEMSGSPIIGKSKSSSFLDSQTKIEDLELRQPVESLKIKKKNKYELHTKFKEMQIHFFTFFPKFKFVFTQFFEIMQSDIVLYNFLSEDQFKQLLKNLDLKFNETVKISKNISHENLFTNLFFEEVTKFKQISYISFQKDLEKILKIYEKLFTNLNIEKKEINKICETFKETPDQNNNQQIFIKQSTFEQLEENQAFEKKPKKMLNNQSQRSVLKPILKENPKSKGLECSEYENDEKMEQEYLKQNRKETKVV